MSTAGARANDSAIGLAVGIVAGVAIWLLSPSLTGYREPWDANATYYWLALFAAGAVGGACAPRGVKSVVAGVFLGQAAVLVGGVLLDPSSGGLWPLGLLFLGLFCVPVLIGAVTAASFARLCSRGGRSPSSGGEA